MVQKQEKKQQQRFTDLLEESLVRSVWLFHLMLLFVYFVLALKKPLISAPKSEGHQPVINLPTEQPHAPNLAPGKTFTSG